MYFQHVHKTFIKVHDKNKNKRYIGGCFFWNSFVKKMILLVIFIIIGKAFFRRLKSTGAFGIFFFFLVCCMYVIGVSKWSIYRSPPTACMIHTNTREYMSRIYTSARTTSASHSFWVLTLTNYRKSFAFQVFNFFLKYQIFF